QRIYDTFLGRVSEGRGKPREEVHAVAQGRVWVGSDALERGLVDKLGSYQDALDAAAELAGLAEGYGVRRLEPKLSWAEQLVLQLRIAGARIAGSVLGPAVAETGSRPTGLLALLQQKFERMQALLADGRPQMHCLCTAE